MTKEMKDLLWDFFATFLNTVGNVIEERYWFSIRGECHMSLCSLLYLTATEVAKFLLTAELANVKRTKMKNSGVSVQTSATDIWQPRLEASNLHHLGCNVAEATLTKMDIGGLMKKTSNQSMPSMRKGTHLLGVGRYERGVTTSAAFQVRGEVKLPEYQQSRNIRSSQRSFFRSTKKLLQEYPCSADSTSKLIAVKDWIQISVLEEDFQAYCIAPSQESMENTNVAALAPTGAYSPMKQVAGPIASPTNAASPETNESSQMSGKLSTVEMLSELKSKEELRLSKMMCKIRGDDGLMSELTTKTTHYPSSHPNSCYPLLNSLNIDVMNRNPGIGGVLAKNQM